MTTYYLQAIDMEALSWADKDSERLEIIFDALEPVCGCGYCIPHKSDCAVHNAPALPPGRCDCMTGNPAAIFGEEGSDE